VLARASYKHGTVSGGWRQDISILTAFPSAIPVTNVPLYLDYRNAYISTIKRLPFAKEPAEGMLAATLCPKPA
jgi:hypothetical protein